MNRGAFAQDPYDMTSEGMTGDVRPSVTSDDVAELAYRSHPFVAAKDAGVSLYNIMTGQGGAGDYMTAGAMLPLGKAMMFVPGLRRTGQVVDDIADTLDLPPGPGIWPKDPPGAFAPAAPAVQTKPALEARTLDEYIQAQRRGEKTSLNYDAYHDIGRTLDVPGIGSNPSRMEDFRFKRKPPQTARNLTHPTHMNRLRGYRDQGLFEAPDGTMVNPWYNPAPLSEKWNDVLGGPRSESDAALAQFMRATGPTSIQTNVSDNIREASVAYPFLLNNRTIKDQTFGRSDMTGAAFNEKVRKLQQIQGGVTPDEPVGFPTTAHKIYNYTRNLMGEGVGRAYPGSPVTLDSQMAEVMRLRGGKGQDLERFTGGMYPAGEDVIRRLGDEVGAAGADTQAAIWQSYLASKHGGRSYGDRYNDSFARALEDRVNKTARERGEDPEDVWRALINGDKELWSAFGLAGAGAAAGVGAFSSAPVEEDF